MKWPHLVRYAIMALLCWVGRAAEAAPAQPMPAANAELERLYAEDQSDRQRDPIDWSVVGARDAQRRKRVLELYQAGELQAGEDFFHAAMVLQHGNQPEDFLLCHELCITAIFTHGDEKGGWVKGAKWLAAASEDRFLGSIDRKQRFGTQFKTHNPDPTWHLDPVDDELTDAIRNAWNVPSLAEARKRELEMNKGKAEDKPAHAAQPTTPKGS